MTQAMVCHLLTLIFNASEVLTQCFSFFRDEARPGEVKTAPCIVSTLHSFRVLKKLNYDEYSEFHKEIPFLELSSKEENRIFQFSPERAGDYSFYTEF